MYFFNPSGKEQTWSKYAANASTVESMLMLQRDAVDISITFAVC